MAIYTGGDLDNLVALINESNPQLPWELDSTNFIYGPPQVIDGATDKQHNTRIRVQAKMSSPYQGSVDLTYRRIKLSTLFRGIKVEIHRWWTGTANMKQILPLINEQFGLNLHDDFGNGPTWTVAQAGQSRVLELNPLNYMYTGQVNIWMYMDKEELGLDVLKIGDIDRIQWPGGNDFSVDRRGQAQFLLTDGDFTEYYMNHNATGSSNINGTDFTSGKFHEIISFIRPDLEFGDNSTTTVNIDGTNTIVNTGRFTNSSGNSRLAASGLNGTALDTEAQILNLENNLRSKAYLDRNVPLHGHGFNRIGQYIPATGYGLRIVNERNPETDAITDYTPIVGELVLKWNRLW